MGKGYPGAIADVAYANGSDNALRENLRKKEMLFKLKAYSGWNTPTNSSGFVIGEGMLAKYMKEEAVKDLLLTRYLDDWAYQANVRNIIARQLTWLRQPGRQAPGGVRAFCPHDAEFCRRQFPSL